MAWVVAIFVLPNDTDMTSKKANSSNAPEVVAPATETLTASINHFEMKRKKFDELSRKMRHLARINADLDFLENSTIKGTESAEGTKQDDQVSKIIFSFSGSSRYDDKSYGVENPTLMQELLDHLLHRYRNKKAELEAEIISTQI